MASGVKMNDKCVETFNKLKKNHTLQYCLFKLSGDGFKEVIVEKEKTIDCEDKKKFFENFVRCIKEDYSEKCLYGAVDFAGRKDKEGKTIEKVIFISWVPNDAKMKEKMVHAATLNAVTQTLSVSDALQLFDKEELDEMCICEKMKIALDLDQCSDEQCIVQQMH
ncbi:cofilin-4-like [Ylistrum balloti]|uniref:cofilin-4-like n=1 Tax=Ylistrum balloti TaxID=509963 RepID=UPI002905EBF2|nr:cofilin-4-like [Ylistrum balloti]